MMVFFIYNTNFVLPERLSTTNSDSEIVYYEEVSLVLDAIIILLVLRYAFKEIKQMVAFGFLEYFLSLWNYIDISIIILLSTSMTIDILYIFEYYDDSSILKLIDGFTIFIMFVRLMSFARGVKGTSFMIRLIIYIK